MNDVLDFLGIVRNLTEFYLWAVFLAAAALLAADVMKPRAFIRADRHESQERKAA
jgi:hypothetical protein